MCILTSFANAVIVKSTTRKGEIPMNGIPVSISAPIIVVYLLAMVIIGFSFARFMKSSDDFMLGGRKMGPWLIGASVFATNISGATLLGFTSTGYQLGVSAFWVTVGPQLGGVFFAAFMAAKLRKMEAYTLAGVIDNQVNSKRSRLVATLASATRDFMYLGSQVVAFGTMFNFLFGIPFVWGAVLGTVVTLAFCVSGGLMAVMWTDYIQLVIIMAATAMVVPMAAKHIGNWENLVNALPAEMVSVGNVTVSQVIGWFLMGMFAYTVAQSMYQRVFSARNIKVAQHGMIIGNMLGALWYCLPFLMGMFARCIYNDTIAATGAEPFLVLATNIGGPVFGSILMAALISALISTASTSINLISSNLTLDIYQRFINPNASQDTLLRMGKITTAVAAVIGFIAALAFPQVLEMIFLGNKIVACIAPAMLLLIFWPKAKYYEKPVFWSMLLGCISLLGYYFYSVGQVTGDGTFIWTLDPIYVGIAVSCAVLLLGILISGNREKKEASK